MKKTDRLIILFCMGGMLLSFSFSLSTIHRQNIRKENAMIEERNEEKFETLNIMIWKKYHMDEMILMKQILIELQKQNKTIPVCNNL